MILVSLFVLLQPPTDPFAKWEKEIITIERKLKDSPPAPGGVTFVGSSTIRLWNLKKHFPDKPYFNAGFGGSVTAEATHFIPRIVAPQKPAWVVFYSGDNDINKKRTAEQVRDDARDFIAAIHKHVPDAKILIIGIKPSIARRDQFNEQQKANRLVRDLCEKDSLCRYLDPTSLILDAQKIPDSDKFVKDGLHLSDAGYAPIAKAVAAILEGK
jgi:lysophospholipase L1-like esterase